MSIITVSDELGTNYTSGTVLGSAGAPDWGWVQGTGRYQGMVQQWWIADETVYGGGWWFPNDMQASVNLYNQGSAYSSGKVAHFWNTDSFPADQTACVCHDPLQNATAIKNAAITVRQSTSNDSCYAAYITYTSVSGPLHQANSSDYGMLCNVTISIYRINNGAYTLIDEVVRPGWTFADDWWFLEMQVSGSNPVNLRVVSRAPESYVAGSTSWTEAWPMLPSQCTYYLPYSPFSGYNSGNYVTSCSVGDGRYGGYDFISGWPNTHTPSTGTPVLYSSTDKNNSSKAWILWEGTDSSANRILSGQPGFRWGDTTAGCQFGFAKFSAVSSEFIGIEGQGMELQRGDVSINADFQRVIAGQSMAIRLNPMSTMASSQRELTGQEFAITHGSIQARSASQISPEGNVSLLSITHPRAETGLRKYIRNGDNNVYALRLDTGKTVQLKGR